MYIYCRHRHHQTKATSNNKRERREKRLSRCFYYYTVYYNLRNDRIRCCYSNLTLFWYEKKKRAYLYIYIAAEAAKQTASHTIPFIHVYMCVYFLQWWWYDYDDDEVNPCFYVIRNNFSLYRSPLFSFGCRASHWEKKYREIPLSLSRSIRLSSSSFRSFLSSHYLLFQTTTTKLETKLRND